MGSGEAFGVVPQRWSDVDKSGHEFRADYIQDITLVDVLDSETADALQDYVFNVVLYSAGLYSQLASSAQKVVLTSAANDLKSLVSHALNLDGRSSAHCARALFEHLINFLDVTHSGTNTAKRYMDHQTMVQDVVSKRREHLNLLAPNERRAETKFLDSLASKVAARIARLRKAYGGGFRRQWADSTLLERAKFHGLESHYDGYRLLSAVIHGSSGGMGGLIREVRGEEVHRVGLDLEMAATALFEGLTFFKLLAEEMLSVTSAWESKNMVDDTKELLAMWPTVRAALRKLDRKMWPKSPTPGPQAVLAIYPKGERWFYYHPAAKVLIPADPPAVEPKGLSDFRHAASKYNPHAFNGRPMTGIFEGATVRPRAGARAIPSSAILVPAGHPARMRKPRAMPKQP